MSETTIYLRAWPGSSNDWRRFDLPAPAETGLAATSWEQASVSAALAWIQRVHAPELAFQLSCRRGICDVCAVRIDGRVVTACTTPVTHGMRIEPTRDKLALSGLVVEVSTVRKARLAAGPSIPDTQGL